MRPIYHTRPFPPIFHFYVDYSDRADKVRLMKTILVEFGCGNGQTVVQEIEVEEGTTAEEIEGWVREPSFNAISWCWKE